MVQVSAINNNMQVSKLNSQPSFKGVEAEYVSENDNKSKMIDMGVKVGLAIAAAVGIGYAIKNGKAAKLASEWQTKADDLTKKVTDLTEQLDEAKKATGAKGAINAGGDNVLTSTYKLLSKYDINVAKGEELVRQGNMIQIVNKNSKKVSKAVLLNTNGDDVSKIVKFEYDSETGKLMHKQILGKNNKIITEKLYEYNNKGELSSFYKTDYDKSGKILNEQIIKTKDANDEQLEELLGG